MAISRGSGTEIIRSAHFEYVAANTTAQNLIYGVRHHIYTVLSIICYAVIDSAPCICKLVGYDAIEGTAQQDFKIFRTNPAGADTPANTTYVFADKFSFNGYEPVDFTGPLDSEAKQDAIADQLVSGDSNRQKLVIEKADTSSQWMISITYIDQNNS